MALSLLQDAQTRGLAAALAGIKREEVDHSLAMSPPPSIITAPHHLQQTAVYPGLHSAAAASALGMLSPSQLLAANRTAAAFMAAQLPMSTLASTLFPHHPALFGSWTKSPPQLPPLNGPHSPPASPISPTILNSNAITTKKSHMLNNNNNNSTNNNNINSTSNFLNNNNNNSPNNNNTSNNNNNNNSNNNNIVSTTIDIPPKKARKISVKKDLLSPPIDIPMKQDIYTPSGPISPPSSGSSPNSQQDLPVHSNSKDPSRDKSFTCKICNRSFGYKHVLQNHERTHTGEKPFECPECHKRFTRDHHLKTHMRLHTGEKPYHCSHCDRQFVQVANLRRHLRVHTGERPYTCEMCEARFSDSNQLKSHSLIHNGEKPFECERCHMKFRRRHHLMHHKCGIQTPPTPAISPAMSDYEMSAQKSTISSYSASDDSNVELNHKSSSSSSMNLSHQLNNHQNSHHNLSNTSSSSITTGTYELPLDLSEDGINNLQNNNNNNINNGNSILDGSEKRSRKSSDIRRVLRLPTPHIPIQLPAIVNLPEQTEPEDLSMRSPKSWHSPISPILGGHPLHHHHHHHHLQQQQQQQQPQQQLHTHHLNNHHQNPSLSHHDDLDLEDLDDAATLNLKQRQKMMQAAAAAAAAVTASASITPKRYSSRVEHE